MMTYTKKPPLERMALENTRRHYTARGIENLLGQLTKVKQTGQGGYIACCPSHDDKRPSLAITETPEGKVLLHCFGGCTVYEILQSVGLTFDSLFPETRSEFSKPIKNPFSAAAVLRCIQTEALIVAVAACNIANGIKLSDDDLQRLVTAASRIGACYE